MCRGLITNPRPSRMAGHQWAFSSVNESSGHTRVGLRNRCRQARKGAFRARWGHRGAWGKAQEKKGQEDDGRAIFKQSPEKAGSKRYLHGVKGTGSFRLRPTWTTHVINDIRSGKREPIARKTPAKQAGKIWARPVIESVGSKRIRPFTGNSQACGLKEKHAKNTLL